MKVDECEDRERLRLLREGDETAFVGLYEAWQGRLYRFAWRMSGSAQTAEDVTQEVFLALIDGAAGYDPERGALSSYLYGMARYMTLRRLERDRRYVRGDEAQQAALDLAEGAPDPLGALAQREEIACVRAAVAGLPPRYREVIALCELEGLSYAAAAEILGCSLGTVRSRLHRGRALLTRKLAPAPDEGRRGHCGAMREVSR
jgi:RNA polymerase sigma-70 factor, ECF subfamily